MPSYVLEIGGRTAFWINAHEDDGAEILVRSCLDSDMSSEMHVLLRTEDGKRALIEATAGEIGVGARRNEDVGMTPAE